MNRYKHAPVSDFRNLPSGPQYYGPTDETVIEFITMYGIRRGTTHEDIIRQFGTGQYHTEPIEERLKRLVREGRLIQLDDFYKVVGIR